MLSFRLSATEFDAAEQVCRAHGYRSLSLFARCAILAYTSAPHQNKPYDQKIDELAERVDLIAAELVRISVYVRKISGSDEYMACAADAKI